jgi:hypothetical protein
MTLWWIGDALLALAVLPVVFVLLRRVHGAAAGIAGTIDGIAASAKAGSRDLDATALLLTTRDQVATTVGEIAGYGGSLDVILDDAGEAT